ncbi:MAG: rubredoxin [Planctomycetota bacterium]
MVKHKYKCQSCGYVYDPEVGRPDRGTEPGIAFEELHDNWTCPECGSKKHSWPPWIALEDEQKRP